MIGMLDAWDYSRADIDLFLYAHRGELMKQIPAGVNLLPEKRAYSCIESPITEALRKGCLGVAYGRWKARRELRRYIARTPGGSADAAFGYIGRYVTPFLPAMGNGTYDLAISFITPHNPLLLKAKAHRKICWIHTDYSSINVNTSIERGVWGAFDNIVSISPSVTESFCKAFPELRDRIIEVENIISRRMIIRNAEAYAPEEFRDGCFNILSVGRYTWPKNFDNIPDIMRRLMSHTGRKDLHWHIIGYGGDEQLIRRRIAEAGVEDNVHLLGKRENPYPYIAGCDLYIQPSRYEGKSIAVREAQMLGRPVIITDYASSASQLENGFDGLIVPLDNESCARGIANAIADPDQLSRLRRNTESRDYSGVGNLEKIYSLLSNPA